MVRLFQIGSAVVVGTIGHHFLTGLLDSVNSALAVIQ